MTKLKLQLPPPEGDYHFVETDGTIIRGSSWPSVMGLVAAYRERAKFAPGNPVAEVIAQVKQRYPDLVFEAPDAPVPVNGVSV